MSSTPSSEWQKLQDVFYCLDPIYKRMNWDVDNLFNNFNVKISPHSTLLALSSKSAVHPSIVQIYSTSGMKIWSLAYNSIGDNYIIDYCFRNEDLCVVLNDNTYRYYYDFKGNFRQYNYFESIIRLGNKDSNGNDDAEVPNDEVNDNKNSIVNLEEISLKQTTRIKIMNMNIWMNYLVLLTYDRFIFSDLSKHENFEILFEGRRVEDIHCINFLSGNGGKLNFLMSYKATILLFEVDFELNSYNVVDYGLTEGPFSNFSCSPNSTLVALYNSKAQKVFVINCNFDQVLLEYDVSNESSPPYQMEWCGNDAIVLSLRDELKLIGPNQNSISFFYDIMDDSDLDLDYILKNVQVEDMAFTIPILQTQDDGLKIFSTRRAEFLRRIPQSMVNAYQIINANPSSILLDCIDKLPLHSSKAETNISLLKSENTLEDAIRQCIEVALLEFDPKHQKRLLRAASFGKSHCDSFFDSDVFLGAINTLKILNQLRSPEIGIFLSYEEVKMLGWKSVVDLLLNRMDHFLAIKVAELLRDHSLKLNIYSHWCCYKIKNSPKLSDVELFDAIQFKLESNKIGKHTKSLVSTDKLLDVSIEEGRLDLGRLLISIDPSTTGKVILYIRIREYNLALVVAFKDGNTRLGKFLLVWFKDILSDSQFLDLINQNKELQLVKNSMNKKDTYELSINGEIILHFWLRCSKPYAYIDEDLYSIENKLKELNELKLLSVLNKPNFPSESLYQENLKARIESALNLTGENQKREHYRDTLDILKLKERLSGTYQIDFSNDSSLSDVLIRLISIHQLKTASKIAKEHNLSQERLWYMIVDRYCKTKEFEKLYEFISSYSGSSDGRNLKSPIGFKRIIEYSMVYGAPAFHISIYIKNYTSADYHEVFSLFLKNQDAISAAEIAFTNKDIQLLKSLLETITNAENPNENMISLIRGYITRLS